MPGFPDGSVRPSRRRFIQGSSAALAAASLTSLAPRVHAAGDETLKIALVGCGNRGTGAASNALQTAGPVKLWAMADAFADRLQGSLQILQNGGRASGGAVPAKVAERVDVAPERQFVGLDAYRHAIDAADVVLLCQPPGFRPEHFEYAVEQSKHVFMEKPVATDAPGVRRILAAGRVAENKGLKVGVGLQRHHDAKYQETVRRLHDGAIGELQTLRCYWNGGTIKRPVDHDGLTELEYQVRNWYFFSLAQRRPHRRAACTQPGRRQLAHGRSSGQSLGHRRPADARRQGLWRHLRPSCRGIHVSRRHERCSAFAARCPAANRWSASLPPARAARRTSAGHKSR